MIKDPVTAQKFCYATVWLPVMLVIGGLFL